MSLSTDDTNDTVPAGIEAHETAEGRAAALLEALGQGDLAVDSRASYDDGDDDGDGDAAPPPLPKAKPAPELAVVEGAPGDRADRIAAARAKMQGEAAERRERMELAEAKAALAKEREEIAKLRAEVEPLKLALSDPRAFLELAGERLDPEQFAAAIPEMTSDEARTKWRQKRTEQTLEERFAEAVKQAVTPIQAKLDALENERRMAHVERVRREFSEHVTKNAEAFPGFSALMSRNPQKALRFADDKFDEMQAAGVPLPSTPDEVWAAVAAGVEEDLFAGIQRTPATNSGKTSDKRLAGAKANPLGNRASSDRTAIATDDGEDADGDDSFEGRVRRAERALRGKRLSEAI